MQGLVGCFLQIYPKTYSNQRVQRDTCGLCLQWGDADAERQQRGVALRPEADTLRQRGANGPDQR